MFNLIGKQNHTIGFVYVNEGLGSNRHTILKQNEQLNTLILLYRHFFIAELLFAFIVFSAE